MENSLVGQKFKLGPESTEFTVETESERFVLLKLQRGGFIDLSKIEYHYLRSLLPNKYKDNFEEKPVLELNDNIDDELCEGFLI